MELAIARKRNLMTQWDLSKKIEVSQTKVSLFERGHIIPTDEEKDRIAQALGIGVNDVEW